MYFRVSRQSTPHYTYISILLYTKHKEKKQFLNGGKPLLFSLTIKRKSNKN